MLFITSTVVAIALLLFAQSLFSLYLMLYSWEHPERLEQSGGTLEVRSGDGVGTTFVATLPKYGLTDFLDPVAPSASV